MSPNEATIRKQADEAQRRLDALSVANRELTREIVRRALLRKGVRFPERRTRRLTRLRVQQLFDNMGKRGTVRTIGTGRDTRRALVD